MGHPVAHDRMWYYYDPTEPKHALSMIHQFWRYQQYFGKAPSAPHLWHRHNGTEITDEEFWGIVDKCRQAALDNYLDVQMDSHWQQEIIKRATPLKRFEGSIREGSTQESSEREAKGKDTRGGNKKGERTSVRKGKDAGAGMGQEDQN
ncbi:hypothetical protein CPB85DRAFT_1254631 [Mucidula mucida]|nr:hypothetical protein CPB85DRAFT_1254631 [Mucidula mucida]